MSSITVANKDWLIIDAVRSALAAATIEGSGVFEEVAVTTSERQARECQFTAAPKAIVRYVTTRDEAGLDGERNCVVVLEITVAAMVHASGVDESDRLEELLRLKNAAINAVESSLPSDAAAVGDGRFYARRIRWGDVSIDSALKPPWAVAVLPVELGYHLAAAAGH